ncbi:MAG TPA: hypothetical protein VGB83_04970 [Actinomycetota bacterium]
MDNPSETITKGTVADERVALSLPALVGAVIALGLIGWGLYATVLKPDPLPAPAPDPGTSAEAPKDSRRYYGKRYSLVPPPGWARLNEPGIDVGWGKPRLGRAIAVSTTYSAKLPPRALARQFVAGIDEGDVPLDWHITGSTKVRVDGVTARRFDLSGSVQGVPIRGRIVVTQPERRLFAFMALSPGSEWAVTRDRFGKMMRTVELT